LLVGHVPLHFYAPAEPGFSRQYKNGAGCSAPTASPARTALPTAHFDRNKIHVRGQDIR
jgi:hypothetical protein